MYKFWPPKKSTKINFWGPEVPPGGMGVFHRKGWGSKGSLPPSKVRFLLSKPQKQTLPQDVLGVFAGMSWNLGGVHKASATECVHLFFGL